MENFANLFMKHLLVTGVGFWRLCLGSILGDPFDQPCLRAYPGGLFGNLAQEQPLVANFGKLPQEHPLWQIWVSCLGGELPSIG